MATIDDARHELYMRLALDEAQRALVAGEVPVGAVIVANGDVVGSGYNQPISATDPTAHAEINAIRAAARMVCELLVLPPGHIVAHRSLR